MHPIFASAGEAQGVPVWFVHAGNADSICHGLGERERAFIAAAGFEPKAGRLLLLPAADGKLAGALFGLERPGDAVIDPFRPGQLSGLLPPGIYRFANAPHDARLATLAFALGAYQFTRYRKADARRVRLVLSDDVDGDDLTRIVEGVTLARDLINTPSNDLGPAELEDAARALAKQHGARLQVTSGDELAKNFPLVHAVGAGSPRPPRLIDLTWGKDSDPKITLVGKGVCFDTGGLDIKNDAGMLNMKKDMGGAATALALGHMIMARGLNVRLAPASARATSTHRAKASASRSAIPTPRADWCWPTRSRSPTRISRCWSSISPRSQVLQEWRSGPRCRRFSPTTMRLPMKSRAARYARTIRSGACRCGGPMSRCSIPR